MFLTEGTSRWKLYGFFSGSTLRGGFSILPMPTDGYEKSLVKIFRIKIDFRSHAHIDKDFLAERLKSDSSIEGNTFGEAARGELTTS